VERKVLIHHQLLNILLLAAAAAAVTVFWALQTEPEQVLADLELMLLFL
jgi:hypothetical protein